MLLVNAILDGKLHDVELALRQGEDPNAIDIFGFTPLVEAALVNDIEKTRVLLNHGADPTVPDMIGGTPLQWASENNNLELCHLLLEKGADPNAYNNASQPILVYPLLRQQRELKELLYRYGANLKFAQDFINAKLLGHRFELQGCVEIVNTQGAFIELDLEGFFLEFSVGIIQQSLERYRNHFAARAQRQHFRFLLAIIRAFSAAQQLQQFLRYNINVDEHSERINQLLQTEPLLLPVGYEGHAVTFIKCGRLFAKCDRGEISQRQPSVIIYHINNPAAINLTFFKKMLYTRLQKEYVEHDFIDELQLTPLTEFHLSPQKTGNCSWANVEAAVPALLFMLLYKKKFNHTENEIAYYRELSETFYHDWVEWDKEVALHECLESFYYSTDAGKAAKVALLVRLLFEACDYQNPVHVERARKILTVATLKQYNYVLKSYVKVYCQEKRTEQGLKLLKLLEACGQNVY